MRRYRVGLLRRLFFPKVNHYLRAAPTLNCYIMRIEEACCLPSVGDVFEENFSHENVLERISGFVC